MNPEVEADNRVADRVGGFANDDRSHVRQEKEDQNGPADESVDVVFQMNFPGSSPFVLWWLMQ